MQELIVTDFDELKEFVYSDEFAQIARIEVLAEGLQSYNNFLDSIVQLCLTGK